MLSSALNFMQSSMTLLNSFTPPVYSVIAVFLCCSTSTICTFMGMSPIIVRTASDLWVVGRMLTNTYFQYRPLLISLFGFSYLLPMRVHDPMLFGSSNFFAKSISYSSDVVIIILLLSPRVYKGFASLICFINIIYD